MSTRRKFCGCPVSSSRRGLASHERQPQSCSAAAVTMLSRGSSPGQSSARRPETSEWSTCMTISARSPDGMDDHRITYPPSTTSAAPIVEPETGSAR